MLSSGLCRPLLLGLPLSLEPVKRWLLKEPLTADDDDDDDVPAGIAIVAGVVAVIVMVQRLGEAAGECPGVPVGETRLGGIGGGCDCAADRLVFGIAY